jgi:hypothetical protein
MVFVVIAGATIGVLMPLMLASTRLYSSTRLSNAPGSIQAPGFVERTPVLATTVFGEPNLSDAKSAALGGKELAGEIGGSAPQTVPQTAGQHMLVVVHGVDAHVNPAGSSTVVATLRRGLKVNMIERRGKWTLVEDVGHSAAPKRGWVFNTFLDDGDR